LIFCVDHIVPCHGHQAPSFLVIIQASPVVPMTLLSPMFPFMVPIIPHYYHHPLSSPTIVLIFLAIPFTILVV
jgi:hypothetical protein